MKNELRVLLPSDREALHAFARANLNARVPDKMEAEMQSWTARWRLEALDHYLKLGWSYGLFDPDGQVRGFILCQPFVFQGGHTQTLWVEHVEAADDEASATLIDCAVRWAKDKSFQRVLFDDREIQLRGARK